MALLEGISINGTQFDLSPVGDGSNENFDLALSDGEGKIIAGFSGGHIRTKNFDSSGCVIRVTMERGGIETSGADAYSIASFNTFCRTSLFIMTGGAKSFFAPVSGTLYQFSASDVLLERTTTSTSQVALAAGCSYIRFTYHGDPVEWMDLWFFGGTSRPSEAKRAQLRTPSDRLVFQVEGDVCTTARLMLPPNYSQDGDASPLIIWDSGDGSFTSWTEEIGSPGYAGRVNGLNYLRDSGFAVLEIYSWGSYYYNAYPNCGMRSAMPIPTHLSAHEKGVEYVLSRYNISRENIFHISKSGSGKLALFYALRRPSFNLRAIYAMSPVFDDLNFVGWGMTDYRLALYEELNMRGEPETVGSPAYQYKNGTPIEDGGYNGTAWAMHSDKGKQFINDNADKFTPIVPGWMNLCGQTIAQKIADTHDFSAAFWEGYTYDSQTGTWSWTDQTKLPATRGDVCYTRDGLAMISDHIPIMVIMSPTDEQTPYWDANEVVAQILNGGGEASMYTLQTGGHSGPDLSTAGDNYVANVTTRLGIAYAGVSIGWYVACSDIIARFLR